MFLLPASLKKVGSISTEITWWHRFFRRSRAANSLVRSVVGSVRNSNSYKLLCMSSLPASMKRIRSKTAEKTWWLRFSHYKSMGIFSRHSRAANSVVGVQSGQNSNSSKILCMSSLPASLKRIGSIATEKKWWRWFFRRSRAANSIVSGGIWPKFKLSQAFMHVLITCKYEKDPIKNSRENVMT